MSTETLKRAIALAREVGHVFIATADAEGLPHLAAGAGLEDVGDGLVAVRGWFCPGMMANVDQNRHIALIVWNAGSGEGCQLLGEIERSEELAIQNGYDPEVDKTPAMPQVEREMIVRVSSIIGLSYAPHSDLELCETS